MVEFEKSLFIDRPQSKVFDFISNPANDTKWRESTISAEWISEGPIGVGSKSRSLDKFLGRKLEYTSEVTAWDPPNEFGTKILSGPFPFEAIIKLETENGGTRVLVNGHTELGGFFKMAEGLVRRQFEKQMDTEFNELKQVLEESQS